MPAVVIANGRRKRNRGEVETLASGPLRVKVYAGVDPITKRRHYLTETIPAGPTAHREAEKARTRLLAQVDEKRNPRTRATLNQLLDRWLDVAELESTTRRNYINKLERCAGTNSGSSMMLRWASLSTRCAL